MNRGPARPTRQQSLLLGLIAAVAVGVTVAAALNLWTLAATGFVVKGNAASLTEKLRILLDDDELRVRVSAQAREWVVQNRRWDVLAKQVEDIYRELGGASVARR